ncbi:hypothetical protein H0I23_03510 [Cellulophaga sp. HaHaR_3_176]|uniref:hypothetical protein n=1 Tax=Cellulophaga sp. HaHaR_3_176 TaxID=1942464 RepID=UPI001C1F9F26|nr:hypothetical protein [Cellulophaga sp. HaHaR_3_176]QWX84725.1 hypothetical protein H0I23_03510 [Cellulophaga sp. HaHaR_3_176]
MKSTILKFSFALAFGSLSLVSCDNDDDDNGVQIIESTQLYASNNSDGNVTIYDMVSGDVKTLTTASTAAEGIYYDADSDEIIQASRSSNQLNVYGGISTYLASAVVTASISSSSDVQSPRDIAVKDDFVVVSDNTDVDGNVDTPDGRLFVYTKSNGSLTLRNIITTDFALWGIEFVGDDLFAVVDKTNELAVFTSFTTTNTTDATVSASKRIAIEGIVRTHGLAYDNGTMILTDIGDAASDSDGGFHIISDFDSKFNSVNNGEVMAVANNQVRVSGSNTALGNPISAEYDADSETVFIAEAANGGGRVLGFSNADAGGNITPSINNTLSAASSLYFYTNK